MIEKEMDMMQSKDNKLKTLKDLEKLCKCESHCECYEPTPKTLKQEAIKEIKALRNGNDELFPKGINDYIGLILYLKWKFNITDEDLK